MFLSKEFPKRAEEGVVIPKTSIVVRGVEQVVYIIKEGKAIAIPIKIVNQNETYAAVTGDGLTVGSELVVEQGGFSAECNRSYCR